MISRPNLCLLATLLFVFALMLPGCGPGGPEAEKDDTVDPASYAMDVKQRIAVDTENVTQQPKHAKGIVEGTVEFLKGYKENPVGDHGAVYADLLAGSEELLALCMSSAQAKEIESKAQELRATADKLPGESVAELVAEMARPDTPPNLQADAE